MQSGLSHYGSRCFAQILRGPGLDATATSTQVEIGGKTDSGFVLTRSEDFAERVVNGQAPLSPLPKAEAKDSGGQHGDGKTKSRRTKRKGRKGGKKKKRKGEGGGREAERREKRRERKRGKRKKRSGGGEGGKYGRRRGGKSGGRGERGGGKRRLRKTEVVALREWD